MIVGLDAKRAVANYTGLGNYSRLIIDILAKNRRNYDLHLFIPKKKENDKFDQLLNHKNVNFKLPRNTLTKTLGPLWRSWFITRDIRANGIQLYHGLSNELPIGIQKTGAKSVVTIHDVIFLRHPEFYPPIDRQIYNLKFRYACKHADRIIAVSECTKRDIVEFYQIDPAKIDVVYQGCDQSFHNQVSTGEKEQLRKLYNLPERFILNVGSIEKRKNLLLIAKALREIPEDISLVVIGKKTAYTNQVIEYLEEHKLSGRVVFLSGVLQKDLPGIYQCAELFVYPSFYEGFGIPIIEALYSGVPVIAATGSCLEEAGGPDSLYVDPNDPSALATQINRILSNDTIRKSMIKNGRRYVTRFSEYTQTQNLLESYNRCFIS